MTIDVLSDLFQFFAPGFTVGIGLSVIFFLIGYVLNFLLDIIRKS